MEEFSLINMVDTLDESRKQVRGISFGCACEGCKENTIRRSHLIQQRPFLYSVSDSNNKVFLPIDNEIHPRTGGLDLSKPSIVTVGQAFYLPLFCKKHDDEIFKPIETKGFDVCDIRNQLLFSYRALCAQRYLEQKRLALYEQNGFSGEIFELQRSYSKSCIERFNLSIRQLWKDIQSSVFQDYEFKVVTMPRVPICLTDSIVDENNLVNSKNKNKPCNIVYAHLLPFEKVSKLIIGYNKKYVSKKQLKYYESWKSTYDTIDMNSILELLYRCKNWCCHPDFISDKQSFVENWDLARVMLVMEEGGC